MVNSACVTGGVALPSSHSMLEDAQSPVTHANLRLASSAQRVRAHKRPDHEGGMAIFMILDSAGARAKPVVDSIGVVGRGEMAGHTVWLHLFTTVSVVG